MPKRPKQHIARMLFVGLLLLFSVAGYYRPNQAGSRSNSVRTQLFEMPVNFGKTHFIIGLSKEDERSLKRSSRTTFNVTDTDCALDEAYFSPDDDVQQKLIGYIDREKKGILLAIFSFTDKHIAQALLRAKERGVDVQLLADPGFLHDRYTKIDWLYEQGVPVYVYNPKRSPKNLATISNIMHHKFVVFLDNVDDRALVWTGSFNFTKSARLNNQENVVVLSTPRLVKKYVQKFEQLKERATVHTDAHASYGRGSLRNKK
jgi:phosphatidylserine/phosphatidylglycerophosphate/cardiolipin synthase-like enzyme